MGGDCIPVLIIYLFSVLTLSSSAPLPFGAHPLDEKYYDSEVIKCKDGSNYFTRDSINDDFCDCPDGSDEPGTSACPVGRFYCKNLGSRPRFLFSSRINDRICDCCDGSDEYDGVAICPNTCIMAGTVSYHSISHSAAIKRQSSIGAERTDTGLNAQESVEKLNGLKVLVVLQVIVVVIFVAFWVLRRCSKSKRRHHH